MLYPFLKRAPVDLAQACTLQRSEDVGTAGLHVSAEDRARAGRLIDPVAGRQLLVSLSCAQAMLGAALGVSGADLQIARNDAGVPFLPDWPEHSVSMSRSQGWTATALHQGGPIGVDIELIRDLDWRSMLAMICDREEAAAFEAVGGGDRALRARFFRMWTLKEAVMKALGLGFQAGVKRVFVPEQAFSQDTGEGRVRIVDDAFSVYWTQVEGVAVALAAITQGD